MTNGKNDRSRETNKTTTRLIQSSTRMKLRTSGQIEVEHFMQLSWDYVLQPLLNICGGHGLAQQMEPDVVDWLGCVAIKRTTDIKCPKSEQC